MISPTIRLEEAGDYAAIRRVTVEAFGQPDEADLIEALRSAADPFVSLVADDSGDVVGHIAFSPVTIETGAIVGMGLAPMAVMPDRQREGIGAALVRDGLDAAGQAGADAVVVLGHPEYYPQFGFRPASAVGLHSTYHVPDEAFMAIELRPGALAGARGRVTYHPAFERVG